MARWPRPSNWAEAGATLYRTFGFRGAVLRTVHEIRRLTGWFRSKPKQILTSLETDPAQTFAVPTASLKAAVDASWALERAERVAGGEYQAYQWEWRPLPSGSDWLRHPSTGRQAGATEGWWRTRHLDPEFGDIKDLWEPARFTWVYDLVRGYLVSGDERYARVFHERLEDWWNANPPFFGPHWSCGQETTLRATALLYAEANFRDAAATTSQALQRLDEVLRASGERIADATGYAVSQRNNHGISEATGLVLLGARFRRAHPDADRWLGRGARLLERLIPEQFAEDGWYIQHSFTYLRLALDQCILAQHALRSVGRSLGPASIRRIHSAVELLCAVIDAESGMVPNHGASDGGVARPVGRGGYRDFRPVVGAACATFGLPYPGDLPLDHESLVWLGVEPPRAGVPLADGVREGPSGWVAVRLHGTSVFLRAGRYTSRPGHLDPLHVDIRVESQEIVVDPGTFAYNAPAPWHNALAAARVHNGPMLDDREPGVRGQRFLWYRWPRATVVNVEHDDVSAVVVAEIPGRVRRTVRVERGRVVVEDDVLATNAGTARVRWLLHPGAAAGLVQSPTGTVRVAVEGSPEGWFSPHYGRRIASRYVDVEGPAAPGRFAVTTIPIPGG